MTPSAQGPRTRRVFHWWTPSAGDVRLQRRELLSQLGWQVAVRWVFVALGAALVGLGIAGALPVTLRLDLLGAVVGALALANGAYQALVGPVQRGQAGRLTPEGLLLLQCTTDFLALSVLSYATGILETPIVALFLAHVSLLTWHLPPRRSFTMALVAALAAVAPLGLTAQGVLPPQTVVGSDVAARLSHEPGLATAWGVGVVLIFLTTWYLVAQLANGMRQRERALQDDYDRLVEISHKKVRATLRATHELKAPLAAIKSYVYTMRDGYVGELTPTMSTVVQRIGDRCDLLAERISQIIELANLKSLQAAELTFERVDLAAIVRAEAAEAGVQGASRKVTVTVPAQVPEDQISGGQVAGEQVSAAPKAPTRRVILAAERELRAMLANLLSNAVNYSHEGGEVTVDVQPSPAEGAGEAGALVRIVDRGIGIPAAQLARVFEDHFRSDNAVRHRAHGSGLGMAIVAEVVRLHGAHIELDSHEGQGTTVTVTFPPPAQLQAARDAAQERGPGGPPGPPTPSGSGHGPADTSPKPQRRLASAPAVAPPADSALTPFRGRLHAGPSLALTFATALAAARHSGRP